MHLFLLKSQANGLQHFKRVNWFHFVRVHATRNTNSFFKWDFNLIGIFESTISFALFDSIFTKNWVDFWECYRLSSSLKSTQRNFICKMLLHACEREIQSYQKWFKSFQSKQFSFPSIIAHRPSFCWFRKKSMVHSLSSFINLSDLKWHFTYKTLDLIWLKIHSLSWLYLILTIIQHCVFLLQLEK